MEVFGYRKLVAYQKAKEVVKRTYKLLKKFPAEERYAMCDQLRRASVSITSNIAEGVNRYSVKDKSHFIEMSYGSLMEVSSQMEIAEEPTIEASAEPSLLELCLARRRKPTGNLAI